MNVKLIPFCVGRDSSDGLTIMDDPAFSHDPDFPLEIRGYEANTAQDVFVLTTALDDRLRLTLEAKGYLQRSDIILSDGQIVDGWVKL